MFEQKSTKPYCIFRVDVSEKIGTGHFMRCLALASALSCYFESIIFICRDLGFDYTKLISQQEIELHILPSPQPNAKEQLNNKTLQ